MSLLCLGAIDRYENRKYQPGRVQLDRPAVGEAAVRCLVARLRGDAPADLPHVLIPSYFVPGATLAAPASR